MKTSLYVHLEGDESFRIIRAEGPGRTYPRLELGELIVFPTVAQLAQLRAAIDSYLPTQCPCAHCTAKRAEPCPGCGMDVIHCDPCPTCGTGAKQAEANVEPFLAINNW